MIDFKQIITAEIKEHKLSYAKLARKCGLTERSISYYCNGKRSPTLESAEKVFAALGYSFVLVREGHEREEGVSESVVGKRNN
ncbi:helix-turn-helix domain-containing protein [Anaeroarcus burkinensis]|uniref:helix-turn-helix domain-containing protein n=1 Tax=Anaeroarcus burkinensis TaxID=82376 RepID=UPI000489D33B|nr:helix-turn-helix transcriptional regulator [Anaeroarcus burkinensis]